MRSCRHNIYSTTCIVQQITNRESLCRFWLIQEEGICVLSGLLSQMQLELADEVTNLSFRDLLTTVK